MEAAQEGTVISWEEEMELTPKAAPDQSHSRLHTQHLTLLHLSLTCFSSPCFWGKEPGLEREKIDT